MGTLYLIAKILHIMGFVTAVGITLATLFTYNQFWKLYAIDREKGLAAFKSFTYLQRVGMIGLIVVLFAGLTMLYLGNWTFLSLLWFQIKLGLIILIFVNGFTLGRTSTLGLHSFISKGASGSISSLETQAIQTRLKTFQLLQLTIYAVIIVLSVFRVA